MKKIAVVGALWASNFGDVLLAKMLKDKLESMGNKIIFPNASESVKKEAGLLNESFELSESDYVIFCGGGYFSEPPGNSLKWALSRYRALFRYATYCRFKKIPYFIIGAGAGPVRSFFAKAVISHVVASAEAVLLRDRISINTILDISPKANVLEVSDYVLSINDIYNYDKSDQKSEMCNIGIHLTLNGSSQIPPILEFIKNNMHSISFSLIEDNPGEYVRLCEHFPDVKDIFGENIVTYENVNQFIECINTLDMVITSKLHVGIVAATLNKRVCALPYHAKVKRLYDEFGRSDVVLDTFEDAKKVYQHIEHCYKSAPVVVPQDMLIKSKLINVFLEKKFGA